MITTLLLLLSKGEFYIGPPVKATYGMLYHVSGAADDILQVQGRMKEEQIALPLVIGAVYQSIRLLCFAITS